jgi:hypothetical protein
MVTLRKLQGDPEIICHIDWLHAGGIQFMRFQIFNEEAGMSAVDLAVLYTPSDEIRLESLQ